MGQSTKCGRDSWRQSTVARDYWSPWRDWSPSGCAWLAALLLALAILPGHAEAQTIAGYTAIDIPVAGERAATIKAYLRRPAATHPVPAIVGLHGCGGLFRRNGKLNAREADWADRWVEAGYAVILPDSFKPRGFREICTLEASERPIRPRHRATDALAVAAWLRQQPFIDTTRMALVGWSNGGSSVLHALPRAGDFVAAIAFYPGCRSFLKRKDWSPRIPLTILIGDADNWTPPGPCRELAAAHNIPLIAYAGAVHSFDAPNSPRRTRSDVGLSGNGDGKVEVGTDPKARAAAIEAVTRILAAAFKASSK